MVNHGVNASEQATSVSTPVVAESGVPFVVGTAPVQSATNPEKAGAPVPIPAPDRVVRCSIDRVFSPHRFPSVGGGDPLSVPPRGGGHPLGRSEKILISVLVGR